MVQPPEHSVGAVKRKADSGLLSSGLNRTPAQQLLQKRPGLLRAETIAEKPVSGTKTPCATASAPVRAAAYAARPYTISTPVVEMPANKPMPGK